MAAIRPIRTEQDYDAALARIVELMNALSPPEGQIEDDEDPRRLELDVLSDLVEKYEDTYYPMAFPRGCRQKSLLQIITARSWQMAKYDAVLLA